MILKRETINNMEDCHKYLYEFREDKFVVNFYQAGNRDLYFNVFSSEYLKEVTFEINQSNLLLYNCFDNLYNNISFEIIKKYYSSIVIKEYYQKLFINDEIVWESDDVSNEDELNKGTKIYNCLIITKKDDKYIINLINNSNKRHFSISFNTDRSKYGPFVYSFMELMREFEFATEENHQITLDEYINELKLVRRKK